MLWIPNYRNSISLKIRLAMIPDTELSKICNFCKVIFIIPTNIFAANKTSKALHHPTPKHPPAISTRPTDK